MLFTLFTLFSVFMSLGCLRLWVDDGSAGFGCLRCVGVSVLDVVRLFGVDVFRVFRCFECLFGCSGVVVFRSLRG